MITWLTLPDEATAPLPAVRIIAVAGVLERRAALRAFVGATLGHDVVVTHAPLRPPVVTPDAGLHLSSASRDGLAAFGLARCPIGVDIEMMTAATDIAWNVLHADEQADLASLPPAQRNQAFLRLWTVKEAYYKARTFGLDREPSSFAVRLEGGGATIADPTLSGPVEAFVRSIETAGRAAFVSAVLLPAGQVPTTG